MKKIVFVTERLPYPPRSGQKKLMYNYCKILHDKFNFEVVLASFLEEGDRIEPKPAFISKVYSLPHIPKLTKIFNILRYTFIQRKYPMQVSLFWDRQIKIKISNILLIEKPDIVMADMVRVTEYLQDYHGYKIANLTDLLSIRYGRQMKIDMAYVNPYGVYLYSFPKFVQRMLSFQFCKKIILSNEINLLRKYEIQISNKFDKTVFVAQKEAQLLNDCTQSKRAIAIPLGVDTDYFGTYFQKLDIQRNSIGFLGAMNVAHNEAGVIHFIKNILPDIIHQIPNVKFYVIGGGVTDRLKAFSSEHVIFTGRVDDVRKYVGSCRVFVCPLFFGSGIKTKNLEAMAMGVPIVTTEIGAENIHAVNEEDWIVAKSNQKFAADVIRVLTEEALYKKLQNNARRFVATNFTWKAAEDNFNVLLEEMRKNEKQRISHENRN